MATASATKATLISPNAILPAKAKSWHTIVMHFRGHLDEIASKLVLELFGEDKYPGISTAKVIFWGNSGVTPDGRTVAEWEADGYFILAVAGSDTDEHPTLHQGRKKGASAFTLTLAKLGLENEPWVTKIAEEIRIEDLRAGSGLLSTATVVKKLHAQHPDEPDIAFNHGEVAVLAIIKDQMALNNETAKEYHSVISDKKRSRSETVIGHRGLPLEIVMLETDNEQIATYGRWAKGGNAAVVIVKRSTGNVQVFTHKRHRIGCAQIARMFRLEEARVQERDLGNVSREETMREGDMDGVPEWNYFEEGQIIFNGSVTHPHVPPTKLSIHHIFEIVKVVVARIED